MGLKHLLLALSVVVVWGLNFVFIRIGLNALPPLFLCAARFGLAALPGVFFLPRPRAPFAWILGYGVFTFAMQFGFLFTGMQSGISPGLASLVIQVQAFFSIGLAAWIFRERPTAWKLFGAAISFLGIGVVALHLGGDTPPAGLALTLAAALC